MNKWRILYNDLYNVDVNSGIDIFNSIKKIILDVNIFGYKDSDVQDFIPIKKRKSKQKMEQCIIVQRSEKEMFFIMTTAMYKDLKNDNRKQILEYMRGLSIPVGILFCKDIYVYFIENDNYIELKIPLIIESKMGQKFIDVFSKREYDLNNIKLFINRSNQTFDNIEKIKNELTSQNIKKIITNYYRNLYSTYEVDEALSEMEFNCFNIADGQGFNKIKFMEHADMVLPLDEITKTNVVSYLTNNGYVSEESTFTYASLNKSGYDYWANPNISVLNKDWVLILNDKKKKKIYVFEIPSGSIREKDVAIRTDRGRAIDLEILYTSSEFMCTRSKINFKRWLKYEFKYN